jgi:arginine decarboxylase
MIHSKFFLTKGKAVSSTSQLNAFDSALRIAGIDQCNLVQVSSILPENAKESKLTKIPPGAITFCVLSKMDGVSGDLISAGVGYAICHDKKRGKEYGIVTEDHGYKDPAYIEDELMRKLHEMAEARNMKIKRAKTVIEHIKTVPKNKYGSAIVALVYVPGE